MIHCGLIKKFPQCIQLISVKMYSKSFDISRSFLSSISSMPLFPEDMSQALPKKLRIHPVSVGTVTSRTASRESLLALSKWHERKRLEFGTAGYESYIKSVSFVSNDVRTKISQYLFKPEREKLPHGKSDSQKFIDSATPILKQITEAECIQKQFQHPLLAYRGKIDAIVMIDKMYWLISWKTVQENRRVTSLQDTYDASLHLAANIAAYNCNVRPAKRVDRGLLLYLYPTGEPADAIPLSGDSLKSSWDSWLKRLAEFYEGIYEENVVIESKLKEAYTILGQNRGKFNNRLKT